MNTQVIEALKNREETVWLNPDREHMAPASKVEGYSFVHVKAAQNRFMRFLPFIAKAFPETAAKKGVIESALVPIPRMQAALNAGGAGLTGRLYLKDDARLPIAGSVKARGGIHEVLKIAETLAQRAGMLMVTDKYDKIDSEEFREFYSEYTIHVGSTGNLGLSIGRTAARFGFKVVVHMSAEARAWKKELLKGEGVTVMEYDGDYSQAVAAGRAAAEADPMSFFIDDEASEDLFFGYATAAMRIKVQLYKAGIEVDKAHPLFVYLPCGVGGAPGGITFGMRELFGDAVHCFFAEPVTAPCFTLAMAEGKGCGVPVSEIGLDAKTAADGLAVGRASDLVCRLMKPMVSGACTLSDEKLLGWQRLLWEQEQIYVEPSAAAGFAGADRCMRPGSPFADYLREHDLTGVMDQATHIVWATGGGLVPESERGDFR